MKAKLVKNWCIMMYFVILFTERLQSIIRAFLNVQETFKTRFEIYVTVVTISSLSLFLSLFISTCGTFFKSLFSLEKEKHQELDLRMVCFLIGVILLGGMVHTKYTIPVLQFVSYGFLILGLILATFENVTIDHKKERWISLIYLVFFSMAIPVTYETSIDMRIIFYIAETVAMLILLLEFTIMDAMVFLHGDSSLFQVRPFVFMILLDSVVLLIRWKEEINWFVLISGVLSLITWMIGFVINKGILRKRNL